MKYGKSTQQPVDKTGPTFWVLAVNYGQNRKQFENY